MSTAKEEGSEGTCFVVMGFGKKTDFETGRTLDLDKTYKNIIKPAVEDAGLKCVRADEIIHSGLIDVPMYEQLLNADVVVADLSTSNKNAYYELGVRHALKPYTTIIICEDGVKAFPFDLSHVVIRQYQHMATGIDFDEVVRFRKVLTEAIVEISRRGPDERRDSPVYTFLNGLNPPELRKVIQAVAEAAAGSSPAAASSRPAGDGEGAEKAKLYSELMEEAEAAQDAGDFEEAKGLLKMLRKKMKPPPPASPDQPAQPEDPHIIRQLAFVTYKAEQKTPEEALAALGEARGLLAALNPATSNDTETLGLWGAVNKRLWEVTKDPKHLDEAVRAYERGFHLRNDQYNGINFAYMLNVRAAAAADRAEAVADFVQARRIREEVVALCDEWLAANPVPGADASEEKKSDYAEKRYWVEVAKAEAYLGTGKTAEAEALYEEAFAAAPAAWMIDTAKKQRVKLGALLAGSPLKYVRADGE